MSRLTRQFSKILKRQLLCIHWNYLYTLNKFHASGRRPQKNTATLMISLERLHLHARFLPQLRLEVGEWASSAPRTSISKVTAQTWMQLSQWETQEQNKVLPPTRACLAVPASTARVTGAADRKHRDTVGVSYLTTHRGLYLIMLSTEWEWD